MNSSTSNFKPPIAFAIFVLIVIAFEVLISWGIPPPLWGTIYKYSNPVKADALRFASQIKALPPTSTERLVFLIGSSQMREGVDVIELQRRFDEANANIKIVNLAASGGDVPDFCAQADQFLSKKPDLVIIMPFFQSFYSEYDYSKLRFYIENVSTLKTIYKFHNRSDSSKSMKLYLSQIVLACIIPSSRFRGSLLETIGTFIIERGQRNQPKLFAYSINKPKSYFEDLLNEKSEQKEQLAIDTVTNEPLFEDLILRIQATGSDVLVVEGVFHPYFYKMYHNYDTVYSRFIDFMERSAHKHNYSFYSTKKIIAFEEPDFLDVTHLNAVGRLKMTSYFSELIFEWAIKKSSKE